MRSLEIIVIYSITPGWEMFSELFNGLPNSFYLPVRLGVFHPGFYVDDSVLFQELLEHVLLGIGTAFPWD